MQRGMFDTEEKCKRFFKLVDSDNSGFIDRSEVEKYMTIFGGMTKERVDEFISKQDLDNDGKISYEEFFKSVQEDKEQKEDLS